MNNLVYDSVHMNFIHLKRFSTSSVMKLVLDDDIIVDISYGLTSITSSSSTTPFSSLFFSLIYKSWISQIFSSTYLLPFPLYWSNSSASIL